MAANAKLLKSYTSLQRLIARKFKQSIKHDEVTVWANMAAPAWLLAGFDETIVPVYQQLHNMTKSRTQVREAIETSAALGYDANLCSDVRCDIGQLELLAKRRASVQPPTLIFGINAVCFASSGLYRSWIRAYPDAAHFFLDLPFSADETISESGVAYIREQLVSFARQLERVFHREFDVERFKRAVARLALNKELYRSVLRLAVNNPSPICATSFQPFLIPITFFGYYEETTAYLLELKRELEGLVDAPVEPKERIRLLWDFTPIYRYMDDISRVLDEYRAKIVMGLSLFSSLEWPTAAWVESQDDPFYAQAYAYAHLPYRRTEKYKFGIMAQMLEDYDIDAVIFHASRNCKANTLPMYMFREEIADRYGLPVLLFEADILDAAVYSKSQVLNRIEAFLEMVEQRKTRSWLPEVSVMGM
jgi:benzoyl-CoA reductase/2-hydroxyglutaryl-CoA dehydratase subunit BcrC/BadD/HgdB